VRVLEHRSVGAVADHRGGALQPRAEDVDHAQAPIADQRPDVAAEVDRDAVGERPVASQRDSQRLPNGASTAVRGDEVSRTQTAFGAAVAVSYDGGHPVAVGVARGELRVVAQLRTQCGGVGLENRLQPDLCDEEPRRRAEILDAVVDVLEVVLELAPAERLDRHDGPVLLELALRRLDDLLLETEPAVQLDGAL
jgi:hypothetical protein